MRIARIPTSLLLAGFLTLSPAAADALNGDCGQPASNGAAPVVSDCLYILQVVVGLKQCVPECICGVRGTTPAAVTDALICLQHVTGLPVAFDCQCSTTSTSTTMPGGDCLSAAGFWQGSEMGEICCDSQGVHECTPTSNDNGSFTLFQEGCDVSVHPTGGLERTGTISGDHIQFSGLFGTPQPGAVLDQNVFTAEGTVSATRMDLVESATVSGRAADGREISCMLEGTGTFTRPIKAGQPTPEPSAKAPDLCKGIELFGTVVSFCAYR